MVKSIKYVGMMNVLLVHNAMSYRSAGLTIVFVVVNAEISDFFKSLPAIFLKSLSIKGYESTSLIYVELTS